MGELRKDYIIDRWVYIETGRGRRPHQFKHEEQPVTAATHCFFCPGNEKETPPEIGRVSKNGQWQIRWFENKFPALRKEGNPDVRTDNNFFTFANNYGVHEVIVETPEHTKQTWDMSVQELTALLGIYDERIRAIEKIPGISYVTIMKNQGREAGASIAHAHSQVFATARPSALVLEETQGMMRTNSCAFCSIIEIEKQSLRRAFENQHFCAFTPYASRFPFELWIFPKRHIPSITGISGEERAALADIMRSALLKLRALNAPYNYYIHNSLRNHDFHFHIEILPRLSTPAGFEYATDMMINSMPPEDAAAYYRGEST